MSWSAPFPRDLHDYILGRDFLNFWIYGREAWTAAAGRFYDIDLYNDHLRALIGWDYAIQQWSYPPHILFFVAPFGLMPYGLALAVWTILGVLTFVLTPYLMSYDLLIAGWIALALYKAGPVPLSLRISAAGLYWLPIIALAMAVNGIPGSALIPIAMTIGLLQAMTRVAGMDRSALVPRGYP